MSELSDNVLPLIRTRSDLYRWSAANSHGAQMHRGVGNLEQSMQTEDPVEVYAVLNRAIASALKVIMRADDSSGIIGDACRRLVALHPQAALAAHVPPARLVPWMMDFQFNNECTYFRIDPVAYAPALGAEGVAAYRQRLAQQIDAMGPRPAERWQGHDWLVIEWNEQRLAVLDQDVDAIIRTYARDRRVAAWLHDTARAFEEIGRYDLAIDWARDATFFDLGHQSMRASGYWCTLLADHRREDLLQASLEVFRRWPTHSTASRVLKISGEHWDDYEPEVQQVLSSNPSEAVAFTLLTLHDVRLAWQQAHDLDLNDAPLWDELVKTYVKIDPVAVIPVLQRRVTELLVSADARNYKTAARNLKKMRQLAKGTQGEAEVDRFVAEVRHANRNRPRLQLEFDKAGLP